MYNGGASINQRTERIIRAAGLIAPVALLVYGLLIIYGVVPNSHLVSDTVFYALMAAWLIVGIYQFSFKINGRFDAVFRMGSYHVFAALYLVLVSGFSMPFFAGWVILLLANYVFFSARGLRLSLLWLFFVCCIDILVRLNEPTVVFGNLFSVAAVLIVGLTVVYIGQVQEVDAKELTHSKAQENLQRDRILTLINNLADAILSTDNNGVIRVYNAASLGLLDTNQNLNGRPIDDVMILHDRAGQEVNLTHLLKKSRSVVVRDDLTYSIDGSDAIRLEVTISPIRSSFTQHSEALDDGYIIILRDITKAKSLEEERDEFISVVSHELRTPITVTEGTLSNVMLMMERPEFTKETLKTNMAAAHDQVVYLARMVNDLSTLSRAERGVADTPEEIALRPMIHELYNEYQPHAEKKGLHFNLDLSDHLGRVTVSQLYLKELLQNFITNAIKYTTEGSVTLIVTNKNDRITFAVKDTGIGISKSDQQKVFNKFYRSEDYRTRETGGTGLGLYVAAKLAKKLSTKITLTSRLNHGSTFSFSLPTTASIERTQATRSAPADQH